MSLNTLFTLLSERRLIIGIHHIVTMSNGLYQTHIFANKIECLHSHFQILIYSQKYQNLYAICIQSRVNNPSFILLAGLRSSIDWAKCQIACKNSQPLSITHIFKFKTYINQVPAHSQKLVYQVDIPPKESTDHICHASGWQHAWRKMQLSCKITHTKPASCKQHVETVFPPSNYHQHSNPNSHDQIGNNQ